MFCGVYVQYLWHFTNVMNAADKTNPVWNVFNCTLKCEHPPAPHLHLLHDWGLTEGWEMCHWGSIGGKQVACGCVVNGSQLLLLRHWMPKAAGWVTASGERWLMLPILQLRDVSGRAPPSGEVCVERHLNSVSYSFNQATMAGSEKQLKKKKTLFKPPW